MNAAEPLSGTQTNQRAELSAILHVFQNPPYRHLHIFTDSQYSINCITLWSKNWEKNEWRAQSGKPVQNADLVKQILSEMRSYMSLGFTVEFEYIRGHVGHHGNEEADKLANLGASKSANVK